MRNPIYALGILLTIAVAALMTGCDYDPSPSTREEWFLYDTSGNKICDLFPSSYGTNVRVTADGRYVFCFKNSVFVRYSVESGEETSFDWPFDEFESYLPSYTVIYLQARIGETWDLYAIDVETGAVKGLTDAQAEAPMTYSVEYDRDEVYYVTNVDSLSTVRRLDLLSSADDSLVSTTVGQYKYPAVSPNGEAVYYHFTSPVDSLCGVYRLDLSTQIDMLVYPQVITYSMSIGFEEQFIVQESWVRELDAEHHFTGYVPLGTVVKLMADRVNVVHRQGAGGWYIRNMLTGNDNRITDSLFLNSWVSLEGHLMLIEKTVNF